MSPYILENLQHIQNIEQVGFNIIDQLNIGINIVEGRDGQPAFLTNLRDRLILENHIILNREEIIELVNDVNGLYSSKEICVLILCWGIYFTVVYPQGILGLSLFLNSEDDLFFDNLRNQIHIVDYQEPNEIVQLFNSFQYQQPNYIPGVGYAFFTKFFFFFSDGNNLPILDKWLTKAFMYLVHTDEDVNENQRINLTHAISNQDSPFGTFTLRRDKPNFYHSYFSYMHSQLNEINNQIDHPILLSDLETFLFGWPLNGNGGYENPRNVYNQFF
ncbi:8-oxoguanine DNA glycosylase OGG fold protein [Namhaeicola litoreus]|uniref:Uncharacterized protein n=1 Tax=Namhaeicola litoreus TaxID=1052145 RepID=A0ABW3XXE1_9FLAO